MENNIKGYCVLTDTISGWELVWRIQEETNEMPQVFSTEKEARKEIAEDVISDLQEYIAGDRDWEEVHQVNEYMVAEITIDADGKLIVWETGKSGDIRDSIIETTLEEWRKGL